MEKNKWHQIKPLLTFWSSVYEYIIYIKYNDIFKGKTRQLVGKRENNK